MANDQPGSSAPPRQQATQGPAIPPPGFAGLPPIPPGPGNPDPRQITPAPGTAAAAASSPTATSTPASSDGQRGGQGDDLRAGFKSRAKLFRKLAETALRAAGGLLNRALASGPEDTCWLPDEDDEKTIPPPLARLAARRVELPVDEDKVTDAEDLLTAAIALGAWLLKGAIDWAEARRELRRRKAGVVAVHQADAAAAAAAQDGAVQ